MPFAAPMILWCSRMNKAYISIKRLYRNWWKSSAIRKFSGIVVAIGIASIAIYAFNGPKMTIPAPFLAHAISPFGGGGGGPFIRSRDTTPAVGFVAAIFNRVRLTGANPNSCRSRTIWSRALLMMCRIGLM